MKDPLIVPEPSLESLRVSRLNWDEAFAIMPGRTSEDGSILPPSIVLYCKKVYSVLPRATMGLLCLFV